MRRTISEKIINHQKKEEYIVKHKTQYQLMKEEFDQQIKDKLDSVQDKVCLLLYFYFKFFLKKIYQN